MVEDIKYPNINLPFGHSDSPSLSTVMDPDDRLGPAMEAGGFRTKIPYSSEDRMKVSQSLGIPMSYCTPDENGGPRMTRHEMNGIGHLCTVGTFANRYGFRPTFSQEVSDSIGGYPKGSILRYYPAPPEHGYYYEVISMEDHNTKNFVRTGSNPNPYEIGSVVNGKVWWRFVETNPCMSMFPDFRNRVLVDSVLFRSFERKEYVKECITSRPGWIYISTSENEHTQRYADSVDHGITIEYESNVFVETGGVEGGSYLSSNLFLVSPFSKFILKIRNYTLPHGTASSVSTNVNLYFLENKYDGN